MTVVGKESTYVLGAMVPSSLPIAHATENVSVNARPLSTNRQLLRRISSLRNAWTLIFLYLQTILIMWGAITYPLFGIPIAFVLMGRAHAQFASLMHESAHRVLFANKRMNDSVGRWLLGFVVFTSTDAYRRVHMAHHRQEFGPDEPDIALYANYPITLASFQRKLVRDATGQTAIRLLRQQMRGVTSPDARVRHTLWKMIAVQALLFGICIALGHWWIYPVLWVLPFLTMWRVINRLRSIAEHGGLRADSDRRVTTHSVRQNWLARFYLVPYNIGFHLAHHVDAGLPFRSLPRFHRQLLSAGYVADPYEYTSYRQLWIALRAA
ncbi:MAG: fatty acid desaturase [Ilumatobacteraceae bacterium]|nr:fatty acid desaturase [Ilumatobacteraceae bacterium]